MFSKEALLGALEKMDLPDPNPDGLGADEIMNAYAEVGRMGKEVDTEGEMFRQLGVSREGLTQVAGDTAKHAGVPGAVDAYDMVIAMSNGDHEKALRIAAESSTSSAFIVGTLTGLMLAKIRSGSGA